MIHWELPPALYTKPARRRADLASLARASVEGLEALSGALASSKLPGQSAKAVDLSAAAGDPWMVPQRLRGPGEQALVRIGLTIRTPARTPARRMASALSVLALLMGIGTATIHRHAAAGILHAASQGPTVAGHLGDADSARLSAGDEPCPICSLLSGAGVFLAAAELLKNREPEPCPSFMEELRLTSADHRHPQGRAPPTPSPV